MFNVDATSGKSQIVVIHSDGPLFPELHPRQESVEGFAEALKQRASTGGAIVRSIDFAPDGHALIPLWSRCRTGLPPCRAARSPRRGHWPPP